MTKYVIGNWKLNPASLTEALALAYAINSVADNTKCQLGCTPSFLHLDAVSKTIKNSSVWVGAQDVCALGDRCVHRRCLSDASGRFGGKVRSNRTF